MEIVYRRNNLNFPEIEIAKRFRLFPMHPHPFRATGVVTARACAYSLTDTYLCSIVPKSGREKDTVPNYFLVRPSFELEYTHSRSAAPSDASDTNVPLQLSAQTILLATPSYMGDEEADADVWHPESNEYREGVGDYYPYEVSRLLTPKQRDAFVVLADLDIYGQEKHVFESLKEKMDRTSITETDAESTFVTLFSYWQSLIEDFLAEDNRDNSGMVCYQRFARHVA